MRSYRFFWRTHKWTGVVAALLVVMVASSGFLLLLKKKVAWIQAPLQAGTETALGELLSIEELWQVLAAQEHPDFREPADIARVDLRLTKFVYRVHSEHNHSEIQVDAGTGEVLGVATRTSDWLESLHDGSLIAGPVHEYLMPAFAVGLVYLAFSGVWLWLAPILRRARKRRERARTRDDPA